MAEDKDEISVTVTVHYEVDHPDPEKEALGMEVVRRAASEFVAGLHARFDAEGLRVMRMEMGQGTGSTETTINADRDEPPAAG